MDKINLCPTWQNILSEEIKKEYFRKLLENLDFEYQNYTCYPPKDLMFSAFNHCSFNDLKIVIIGQDPYHGENEANGLCFSVNDQVKIPPSLRNIFKEINDDLGTIFMPTNGNLTRWAKQGILLLNNSLTVRKGVPNSHKNLNWSIFTDAVIEKISTEKSNIVFLLWGKFAQQKGLKIDRKKHLVLESGHPSFAPVHKKWFDNKHFSQTNAYLQMIGKDKIEW
jgi:uracil-DNA glycosylase